MMKSQEIMKQLNEENQYRHKGKARIRYIEEEITVTQSKIDKRLCEEWSLPSNY